MTEAGEVVSLLIEELRSTQGGLKNVPGLLKRVIREGMWQARVVKALRGKVVEWAEFKAFVEAPPPEGLGSDLSALAKLCKCDLEALDLFDVVTQRGGGAPPGNKNAAKTTFNNVQGCFPAAPVGNARQAALRRLRDGRPDLHRRVLAGDLSAHAAMVEAGFRKVPSLVEQAQKLIGKMTGRERAALRRWWEQEGF